MPTNNTEWLDDTEVLSFDELTRLASIFVDLGIEKIRITGGEPLVRPSLEKLINSISMIPGINSIGLTTNGLLLGEQSKQLSSAGLSSVNVSLDSFKEDRFKMMTGVNGVDKVIRSIQNANDAGLDVKINTVVIRGWNDDEIVDFALFSRDNGYTVRFIEFMPLDGTGIWKQDLVFSKREMIDRITLNIGEIVKPHNGDNQPEPAMLYSFVDGKGTIGFIPSITEPFCGNCDRARITSDGRLLSCLFENPGHNLKGLLRSGATDEDIACYILDSISNKPEGIIKMIKTKSLKPTLNLMHTIGG